MAAIGQQVLFQSDTGRYRWAVVAGNIDGDTADLCVFSDGDEWENMALADNVTYMRYAKDMGTGVDEWMPNSAGQGPQGEPGEQGEQGPQGDPGEGFGTITLNTPSRTLGTAFQVSTTRPALVSYSARVVSALSLAGGQAGRVELRSDASNPPTTVRQRVAGGLTGTVVVGVAMSDTAEGTMTYLVPAGHYVLLQSVNETGTPTYSLPAQVEEIL